MSEEATPSRDLYEACWSQASPPPFSDPLTPRRRELLWRLLGEYGIPPGRLLDCGAGDGGLVADADAHGLQATGLKLAQAAITRSGAAHPGIELIRHSIEDRPWPVPPDSFDCVVAFEVIEHLLRPAELLAGAYPALAPDGHLAPRTPYHGRLKNLAIALVAFDRHFDPRGERIRFFTDRALRVWGLWASIFTWARRV